MLIGLATNAQPQEQAVARLLESKFNESYDPTSAVSGSVVAGIRLGKSAGKLTVNDIRLAISSGNTLCVRTLTRDGRFTSDNRYAFESSRKVTRLLLSPVTERYVEVLSGYDSEDFAVNAFMAIENECVIRNAVHLPQIIDAGKPSSTLTILVNSSSRTTTLKGPGIVGEAFCEPVSAGARIAYDRECVADIARLPGGLTQFTVSMDDGFGLEEVSVKVLLPAIEDR